MHRDSHAENRVAASGNNTGVVSMVRRHLFVTDTWSAKGSACSALARGNGGEGLANTLYVFDREKGRGADRRAKGYLMEKMEMLDPIVCAYRNLPIVASLYDERRPE